MPMILNFVKLQSGNNPVPNNTAQLNVCDTQTYRLHAWILMHISGMYMKTFSIGFI